jgi:biotin transport system substrate-specific component
MKLKSNTARISSEILLKEVIYVMSAVLMLAALSRVTIPLQPVPVTGQTLGILLTGMMLGRKRALAATLTYLAMGIVGFPVFANGAFGLATLIGPTGGYLLGFVPAAFVMGWLGDKGWYNKALSAISALLIGHAIIFASGLLWLSHFTGWSNVLAAGFIPFLPGAVAKTLIAFVAIPVLNRINN